MVGNSAQFDSNRSEQSDRRSTVSGTILTEDLRANIRLRLNSNDPQHQLLRWFNDALAAYPHPSVTPIQFLQLEHSALARFLAWDFGLVTERRLVCPISSNPLEGFLLHHNTARDADEAVAGEPVIGDDQVFRTQLLPESFREQLSKVEAELQPLKPPFSSAQVEIVSRSIERARTIASWIYSRIVDAFVANGSIIVGENAFEFKNSDEDRRLLNQADQRTLQGVCWEFKSNQAEAVAPNGGLGLIIECAENALTHISIVTAFGEILIWNNPEAELSAEHLSRLLAHVSAELGLEVMPGGEVPTGTGIARKSESTFYGISRGLDGQLPPAVESQASLPCWDKVMPLVNGTGPQLHYDALQRTPIEIARPFFENRDYDSAYRLFFTQVQLAQPEIQGHGIAISQQLTFLRGAEKVLPLLDPKVRECSPFVKLLDRKLLALAEECDGKIDIEAAAHRLSVRDPKYSETDTWLSVARLRIFSGRVEEGMMMQLNTLRAYFGTIIRGECEPSERPILDQFDATCVMVGPLCNFLSGLSPARKADIAAIQEDYGNARLTAELLSIAETLQSLSFDSVCSTALIAEPLDEGVLDEAGRESLAAIESLLQQGRAIERQRRDANLPVVRAGIEIDTAHAVLEARRGNFIVATQYAESALVARKKWAEELIRQSGGAENSSEASLIIAALVQDYLCAATCASALGKAKQEYRYLESARAALRPFTGALSASANSIAKQQVAVLVRLGRWSEAAEVQEEIWSLNKRYNPGVLVGMKLLQMAKISLYRGLNAISEGEEPPQELLEDLEAQLVLLKARPIWLSRFTDEFKLQLCNLYLECGRHDQAENILDELLNDDTTPHSITMLAHSYHPRLRALQGDLSGAIELAKSYLMLPLDANPILLGCSVRVLSDSDVVPDAVLQECDPAKLAAIETQFTSLQSFVANRDDTIELQLKVLGALLRIQTALSAEDRAEVSQQKIEELRRQSDAD